MFGNDCLCLYINLGYLHKSEDLLSTSQNIWFTSVHNKCVTLNKCAHKLDSYKPILIWGLTVLKDGNRDEIEQNYLLTPHEKKLTQCTFWTFINLDKFLYCQTKMYPYTIVKLCIFLHVNKSNTLWNAFQPLFQKGTHAAP